VTWVAKTLHVTPTGRAKPNGRTTRASQSVKKTKYAKRQDRPLGFDLQCHPQALARTSRNPGCATVHLGFDVHMFRELDSWDFLTGVGLVRTSRTLGNDWLLVRIADTGEPLGFASPHEALSYCRAAAKKGVRLESYRGIS